MTDIIGKEIKNTKRIETKYVITLGIIFFGSPLIIGGFLDILETVIGIYLISGGLVGLFYLLFFESYLKEKSKKRNKENNRGVLGS